MDILQGIGIPNLAISIVTTGELYYGVIDRRELQTIKSHLSQIQQIPLDTDISALTVSLLEEYVLSHKLSVPDALIAATAIQQGLPLYPLNIKDLHYIPDTTLPTIAGLNNRLTLLKPSCRKAAKLKRLFSHRNEARTSMFHNYSFL